MNSEVDKVLEERGENYGSYNLHSIVSESVMKNLALASNFNELPAHLEHTFRLIVDKMVRAANGNWKHRDNLVDIIGYATLSLKELDNSSADSTLDTDYGEGDLHNVSSDHVYESLPFTGLVEGDKFLTNDDTIMEIVYTQIIGRDVKAVCADTGNSYWYLSNGVFKGADAGHPLSYKGAK